MRIGRLAGSLPVDRNTLPAAVKPNYLLDRATSENMDNRRAFEIVSLAEFKSCQYITKAGRRFDAGCPFIHVSKEQTGFDIFQYCFHRA